MIVKFPLLFYYIFLTFIFYESKIKDVGIETSETIKEISKTELEQKYDYNSEDYVEPTINILKFNPPKNDLGYSPSEASFYMLCGYSLEEKDTV